MSRPLEPARRLARRLAALSPAQRRLFEQLQRSHRAGAPEGTARPAFPEPPPIPRRPPAAAWPLSFGQKRLWLLDRLCPGSPAYNVPFAGLLQGDLDVRALRASLDALARRHEALRTRFLAEGDEAEGEPVQVVVPADPNEGIEGIAGIEGVALPWIDLSALPPPRRPAELDRLALEEGRRPFDLARGPLLRAALVGLEPREHALLLTLPHIVTDSGSMAVIARDLQAFYGACLDGLPAAAAGLPELRVQGADFAVWQRERLRGEVLDRLLEHWCQTLAGVPTRLDLPADRPRPPARSGAGARLDLALPPRLSEELRLIGALKGVTPFMLLLAAFGALVGRYTGRDDFLVGSPFAGRTPDTEEVVGFFVNTLALRLDLRGDPAFAELLGRVRETCLAAYAHRELPFDCLVQAMRAAREEDLEAEPPCRPPLVQVILTAQNGPPLSSAPSPSLRGLSWTRFRQTDTRTAKADLLLGFWQSAASAGDLEAWIEYDADLFDAATVHRLAGHLLQLLNGVVAAPGTRLSELPLLGESERRRLLVEWNATDRPYPQKLAVHELFEAWAERSPDAVAVAAAGGRGTLTYGELDRRAARLARRLRRLGVGPEVVVALIADRSPGMVVGLLAVLKAGGAYLPLDATYPIDRLRFVLEDSGAAVLLVPGPESEAVAGRLRTAVASLCLVRVEGPEGGARGAERGLRDPDDDPAGPPGFGPWGGPWACHLAYVVYTSGSTGRPKGVAVEHRGLPNLVLEQVQRLEVGPEDRVLQLASPSFDAFVWEVWMALATGARLCLARPEELAGGASLLRLLREQEITHLTVAPSILATLGEPPAAGLPALRVVCVAGEPCPAELGRRWGAEPGRRLLNGYGLTETTVCATLAEIPRPGAIPPVGRPLANVRAYVLDGRLEPAPVGVPGEVYLGGLGLARGYVGLPALTAERFLPDPFAGGTGSLGGRGGRLLRTGDLGRFRPDGQLELMGRIDAQIKVRGVRVEPAEVEAALLAHPGVLEAAVAVSGGGAGAGPARLAAFLVPHLGRPEEDLRPAVLRAVLAERLPASMLPAVFVQVPALPRTPSGKVDRGALARLAPPPEPHAADPAGPAGPDNPANTPRHGLEAQLARLWAEVLGVERVGIDQSFFALGGDSLLGFQLAARAGERGLHFAPRQLFERPTVAALARVVRFDKNERTPSADPFRPPRALEA